MATSFRRTCVLDTSNHRVDGKLGVASMGAFVSPQGRGLRSGDERVSRSQVTQQKSFPISIEIGLTCPPSESLTMQVRSGALGTVCQEAPTLHHRSQREGSMFSHVFWEQT